MAVIYHLIYTSRITGDVSSDLVSSIVNDAALRNQKSQITGFLIERQGHFMQLLEGDQYKVLSLFSRIEADPRHEDIRIQAEVRSDTRICPKWSMVQVGLNQTFPTSQFLIELFDASRSGMPFQRKDELLNMLHTFAGTTAILPT